MDLQDLRIFARVAAAQNLTAVGHELGLTPGTISKRLQALEDELQVRLFDRTTRSVRITPEGQQFLSHAERILDDVEKARASVGESASRPQGTIRLTAPTSLGRYDLGPAIAAFLHRYPEIDMIVDLRGRPGSLLDEGFDLAIRIGEQSDSTLMSKRIAGYDMILAASPSYLKLNGIPRVPADLSGHSCLLNGECTAATWSFTDRRSGAQDTIHVRVSGRLRSNGAGLLARSAIEGHGIVRCSEDWVRDDLASGQLVQVLDEFKVNDDIDIYAVYPSARHVLPRVRVLIDFLSEWFKDVRRSEPEHNGPMSVAAE